MQYSAFVLGFIREGRAKSVNKFHPRDMGHQGPKAFGSGEVIKYRSLAQQRILGCLKSNMML